MFWIFVEPGQVSGGEIVVEGRKAHHLARVLRVRPGERGVVVANDREHIVEVVNAAGSRVVARIEETRAIGSEPAVSVTVFQSLLPNPDFDAVIEGTTAVGVIRLIAIEASRSVRRAGADRRERWRAIAESAAEQSHRGRIPEISGPLALSAALPQAQGRCLVLDPRAAVSLTPSIIDAGAVTLAVGPEGGWTDAEHDLFRRAGATAVSLGPRILRARLAPVIAAAILVAHA